ncbi:hypothetical protein [Actinopolymorpha cephalotaxi]|uniref:Uncharacterized protein n=1 Tax=Actinopolymorpha cephalotaxi TaxID=504797 RepID=A0ABX2S4U1_9ACTN|nr:hypothetical protein [Actinopolymorpha cephalotaxi]NYH83204.1 hypothetical protein [Actinopolymorpha cephalotaxi]
MGTVEDDTPVEEAISVQAAAADEQPPEYDPTGRPDVDAVLDRLGELAGLAPSDHIDIYEDAHRRLHETLLAAGEDHGDDAGRP